MGGLEILAMSKTYEAVTGDDKYEDAWRKPTSTLFGGDKESPVAATPGADPALDATAQAAREEEIRKKLRMSERGGRASTILTGSSGLSKMAGGSTRRTLFGE